MNPTDTIENLSLLAQSVVKSTLEEALFWARSSPLEYERYVKLRTSLARDYIGRANLPPDIHALISRAAFWGASEIEAKLKSLSFQAS